MKKNFLAFVLAFTFVFPSALLAQTATRANSPARAAARTITAAQLRDYLYFVASDEMEGRDTPSRGLDLTAKFIALQLSRWGVKPAGDNGTYFQKIDLRRDSLDEAATRLNVGGTDYALGTDFFRVRGTGTANAPVVYGGGGWMVKAKNIDALGGVDVKGKIVVLYGGGGFSQRYLVPPPAGVTPDDLKGTNGTDWADPVTNARQKGAAGIILVAPPQLEASWQQVRGFFSRGSMYPEKLREGGNPNSALPVMLVSQRVVSNIFPADRNPLSAPNVSAFDTGKTANLSAASRTEMLTTQNVVGMIEGSDPRLKAEMVAIGAHYDHDGVNPNAPGADKIWNGADDDGSGTVAVLSIAEALAKSARKPKRSVIFVWHAGEEKGLWGSEYFTKFPTVPINNIVAQLNIDMIGRSKKPGDANPKNKELSGENEIYVIGSRMMSTQLGNITESVNKSFMNMTYNYRYDDPKDPNRFFFRSDHFNYAARGIPIVFWFDGVHEDYHQATDHADKIDYPRMEKITQTIFLTLWEVADAQTRPAVDKQLPPELTQR